MAGNEAALIQDCSLLIETDGSGGKSCAACAFFSGLYALDSAGDVVHSLFRCAAGKTVDAVFSNGSRNSVSLVVSDGRSLSLPQARSGSGARYASANQNFVFWNKGDTAFIEENGQPSFSGCSTRP